ncbi:hypothetical protein [Bacteroides thetaiotaomicron]|uniref:hypothetical protein n=1 Tax=Bacteroides thetaiotaomicron TaxID=818 RepID=UPI001F224C19|nr:hypothetical protein [Bacteroides thetaiotaomicron]
MNIQKAINVIEKVSILIVEKVPPYFVADALNGKFNNEQFDHILDKWFSKDGDLFDFYLNSSSDIQRYLLEALDIEVEPDKYPDYDSRIMAELSGKKRSEIYPFETEILREYVLIENIHDLAFLKAIKEGDLGKLVSLKNEGYMPPNRILESIVKKNTVNTLVTIEKIYDVKIESLKYNDIKLAENDNCQISKDKGLEF